MNKILNKSWLRWLVAPSIIFLILVFYYNSCLKTLSVSFYDEFLWTGRSYFFEYYIKGDFKNKIWQSYESYDQPKLTEYAYGAWLYPTYLKEKRNEKSLDYKNFLIKNGFGNVDDRGYNSLEEYFAKNNIDGTKAIKIINKARLLNVFLLAGSVVLVYLLILQNMNAVTGIIFSGCYGLNYLIINTCLKAHSEALFLFTFNAAFLFMNLYFKKKKNIYLILFSIFTGLCVSTKLNGIMLMIIFMILNIIIFGVIQKNKIKNILFKSILSLSICMAVFWILNPFVYSHPFKNTVYLFDWRMKTATTVQSNLSKENYLPNNLLRIKKIFENFYFSKQTTNFNGVKIINKLDLPKIYGITLFILFIFGLVYCLKMAWRKNTAAIIMCGSFFIILLMMSYYLILDWPRYYVQLVLFFAIFQLLGLFLIVKKICKSVV